MRQYIKEITRHSSIYTLSTLLTRAIGIILLPVYSRFLTPEDYGIIAIIVPLIQACFIVFSFGMPSAAGRFYFDFRDRSEEQKDFFGTVLLFISILGFTLSVVLSIWGRPVFSKIFPGIDFYPYIFLSLWIAFFMLVYNFKLTLYKVRNQSLYYALFSVFKFTGMVVLTIISVVKFNMGALGRVFAEFIVVVLAFILIWVLIIKDINFKIVLPHLKSAMKYALPVVPHALSGIIISLAAKFFLNLNQGLGTTGVYNIGLLIASVLNIIVYSINLSWVPFFMRLASEKKEEAKPIKSQLTTYYGLFIGFIALAIAFYSDEIVAILVTEDYYEATTIIPILLFQYILTGFYYMMVSKIIYVKTAVKYLPLLTISTALVNILMNFLLTPAYGMKGAAWSAVISSAFLFLAAYFVSQKVYPVKYEYKRFILIIINTVILFAAYYYLKMIGTNAVLFLFIKAILLIAYVFLLYAMGFFRRSEIENLKDIYRKIRNRYT